MLPPHDQALADRYHTLLSTIDAGFCLLRIDFDPAGNPIDYSFVEANPLLEVHTGLKDVIGRSIRELVPDIESFWIERYAQVASSGQPVRFEDASDVMGRVFSVHAFPMGAPEQNLVGVLFSDITRQRRRESNRVFLTRIARAFESPSALDEIMTSVGEQLGEHLGTDSCLFCHIDESADTITTSHGWTRASQPNLNRTFKTSDYLAAEFITESRARRPVLVVDTQADARTDAAAYLALNIRSFVTGPHHTGGAWTHYFTVTDASPRDWTSEEVELLQSFAQLVFSKMERAQADAALRISEARFRKMADAVPQIVWITDSEGRTEFFNRQWSSYTGIDYFPTTAADTAADALHPDDVAETMRRFELALQNGHAFLVEHRIRSATGDYRWFLVRAEPELDPVTGRPVRWYGASVDIHDRRLAEQELAATDRRKDEFLATLAHELRNPLAPIRTGLSLLEMAPTPEQAARTRAVMARQLSHMVRLIDDLLDISRINSNKIELRHDIVDIRVLIDEAIEANRPVIDAGDHAIFVSTPSTPLHVDVDRTRLVQVFGNLLRNAAKYTPHGGRIEVLAALRQGQVLVEVQDTGVGIDAADIAVVFDMFVQVPAQADRTQGGLGIGLSLVKQLVELHGGSVGAESAGPGLGSTFSVRLPHAVHVQPVAIGAERVSSVSGALDVLVVDDNVDAAEMMMAVLEASDHRVRMAHCGSTALDAVAASRADVVFLDIGMPGMDGYEVARRIRRMDGGGAICLVALTGWGSDSDRAQAFESGFDHHLTKPVDARRISDLLEGIAAARPAPDPVPL